MRGYAASIGGDIVGWCHAGPKLSFPALAGSANFRTLEDEQCGAIVCFAVAPEQRGRGIARRLLEAACQGFIESGLQLAEGYPRVCTDSPFANYYGPLQMYLDAGFEPFCELEGARIVRKKLA